jgi:hypothetical protein
MEPISRVLVAENTLRTWGIKKNEKVAGDFFLCKREGRVRLPKITAKS